MCVPHAIRVYSCLVLSFDGWLMAIGIDLGFIALELVVLGAPADKRGAVARYAAPAIIATLAISAAMNGFAFEAHADGLLIYPAAALGLAIPALIYALMKVAAALWIGHEPQRLRGI
jgi:hypothetical protein